MTTYQIFFQSLNKLRTLRFHLIFCAIIFLSCNTKKVVPATTTINDTSKLDRCEKTFNFFRNEIIETKEGYYKFKDLEKIFQEYDKYNLKFPFNSCFVGKKLSFLSEIIGPPHKELFINRKNIHIAYFCFTLDCVTINQYLSLIHI